MLDTPDDAGSAVSLLVRISSRRPSCSRSGIVAAMISGDNDAR